MVYHDISEFVTISSSVYIIQITKEKIKLNIPILKKRKRKDKRITGYIILQN